ncbi:MAG: S-methyl-5-thioribose-1-phosphate isomerase [Burkholderiaceae bacterium]
MKIDGRHYRSIWVEGDNVVVIDQTALPKAFITRTLSSVDSVIDAIKTMAVRGAPLIGVAGAYGLALAMRDDRSDANLAAAYSALKESRPTAVNLQWALDRMRALLAPQPENRRLDAAWHEAAKIADEDVELNRAIGEHGANLIRATHQRTLRPVQLLTHCNAGWLATVDHGTALSAIYQAHDAGIPLHVWVDETRPRNQGLLTAWELGAHGVPHTVIVDSAAGYVMQRGQVDLVIVGADRVTANGDAANKIGTYQKALAARDNDVPFYVAAASPTIDWSLRNGHAIPIEQRAADEVRQIGGTTLIDASTAVANPAFDVTPARLINGLITERGVIKPDALDALRRGQIAAAFTSLAT